MEDHLQLSIKSTQPSPELVRDIFTVIPNIIYNFRYIGFFVKKKVIFLYLRSRYFLENTEDLPYKIQYK